MEIKVWKKVWLIILVLVVIGGQFEDVQSAEPNITSGERTISFPNDVSIGNLSVRDWGSTEAEDWTDLSEARGDVTVPAGKELQLQVGPDYSGDFSPLAGLGASDLQELILSETKVSDAELVHLKGLTSLEQLHLNKTLITDEGLVYFKKLGQLKLLHVQDTKVTDAGLVHLEELRSLQRLDIGQTQVTDAGLAHLKSLTNLEGLNLNWTKVTDDGLVHLKGLNNLKWLNLYGTKVTGAGLVHLEGMGKLETLHLSKTPVTDEGLANIKGLTWLEELFLKEAQVGDAGLAHLKDLTSLKLLNLTGKPVRITAKSHPLLGKPLGELKFTSTKGEEIDIFQYKGKVVLVDFWATWCSPCINELPNVLDTYSKYHDDGFEIIGISLDSSRERLEKFIEENDMPWPQYFDGKGWDNEISTGFGIRSIPSTFLLDGQGIVRHVNLRGSALEQAVADILGDPSQPTAQITDAGLVHLKGLTLLETLRLENRQIGDAGLAHLGGLTSLKTLYLGGTQVTDAGLAHLKNLTELESLCVHKTVITDAGLEHLKDLTGLGYLCIHDTYVSNTGLTYLQGLISLKTLYLHNTQVSDAGLVHLKGLTALERLNLRGTSVSKAGLADLKQALPNCIISGEPASKPRPARRPKWHWGEKIPLHKRILFAAIFIPIVCFLGAVFLKIVTGWAVKFSIPYWTAYKVEIIAAVIVFVIRVPFDVSGILWTLLLSFVVHLLVNSIIYSHMIKHPDTNEPIGLGKGLLIWFYLFLIWIPVSVVLGCGLCFAFVLFRTLHFL
ncbi:MAG: redoxin domain-containing protein [Planctomycetota bacterium]